MKHPAKYVTMKRLSALLGVSARTLRTYCELGWIPEAKRKRGTKRWLIPQALSKKTKWRLMQVSGKFKSETRKMGFTVAVGEFKCDGLIEEFDVMMAFAHRAESVPYEQALEMAAHDIFSIESSAGSSEACNSATKAEESETEDCEESAFLKRMRKHARKTYEQFGDSRRLDQELLVAAESVLRSRKNVRVIWIAEHLGVHKSTLYRRYGGSEKVRAVLDPFRVQRRQNPPSRQH